MFSSIHFNSCGARFFFGSWLLNRVLPDLSVRDKLIYLDYARSTAILISLRFIEPLTSTSVGTSRTPYIYCNRLNICFQTSMLGDRVTDVRRLYREHRCFSFSLRQAQGKLAQRTLYGFATVSHIL